MFQVRYSENKKLLDIDGKNLKKLSDIIKKNRPPKEKTIKYALLDNLAQCIDKLFK